MLAAELNSVLSQATSLAVELKHDFVGPEHVLAVLLERANERSLRAFSLTERSRRIALDLTYALLSDNQAPESPAVEPVPPRTARLVWIAERVVSPEWGPNQSCEDLLARTLQQAEAGVAARILADARASSGE